MGQETVREEGTSEELPGAISTPRTTGELEEVKFKDFNHRQATIDASQH